MLSGKPSLVISRGIVQQDELKRLCLTISDLMEGLRMAGYMDPSEVCTAVMEANGTITAFPHSDRRPPHTGEMGVDPGYEGMPMILIMDGRLQRHNLRSARLDEKWLDDTLAARGVKGKDVFLCVIDTQGRMAVQDRKGKISQFEAMKAEEVKW